MRNALMPWASLHTGRDHYGQVCLLPLTKQKGVVQVEGGLWPSQEQPANLYNGYH